VTFANTSIASDCSDIFVYEVSREIFKGKEKQTLSSNFVNFNSFLFYAVKNSKGANVGIVIGTGIVVNVGTAGATTVTVCADFDSSALSADYSVFDFATRYYNDISFIFLANALQISDASYSSLTPLGLSVTREGNTLCTTLEELTG
jgi:hypothetical protein